MSELAGLTKIAGAPRLVSGVIFSVIGFRFAFAFDDKRQVRGIVQIFELDVRHEVFEVVHRLASDAGDLVAGL